MATTQDVNTPGLTTRHIVLEVLSAWPEAEAAPVRALVQVGELFGMADNSVRVALTRLVSEGRVESPERGRYQLGPAAAAIEQKVSSWRRIEELQAPGPWAGGWWLCISVGAARHRSRALRYWGFRELVPGTAVRPDNLTLDGTALGGRLRELGVGADDLLLRTASLAERETEAMGLWTADDLEASYARTTTQLKRSMARLDDMSAPEALREAFLIGRTGIRSLVLDPLLPAPLVEEERRRELQVTVRDYVARGQALWRHFLGVLLHDEGEAA